MEFDSIISILFLLAFFVVPTLFKILMPKKKASISDGGQPSFLGKIGGQIQKFIKDLEEQAQQSNVQYEEQEEVWETLSQEDEAAVYEETVLPKEPFVRAQTHSEDRGKSPAEKKADVGASKKDYRLRMNPLQNAVVWSEILSKPLALREK